jgi:hypothetical protein
VVAVASLAPEHLLLDIARGLGLDSEVADRQLQVKAGDPVAQGDVLAGPVGFLTKRVVRAPRNGRVVLAGSGQILLEVESPAYELKAGLPGTVIDLIGDRGVVVENTGAVVQGVWGNGQVDFGLMNVLAHSADEELAPDRLDVSLRGSLVIGGYCGQANVFKAGSELPLRGLILASLEPSLIPLASRVRFPVMVIEGFGKLGMNSPAFKLLSTSDRREVALNAEPWDRFEGKRPEVIIPLPASGELPLPRKAEVFSPGQQVRIVRSPHIGKTGNLIGLRPGSTALPSGIHAPAAEVRLESGDSAIVPLANLEVLG